MFESVGNKIQTCAKVIFYVSVCIVIMCAIFFCTKGMFLQALILVVAGGLGSWITSLLMHGFGDLIINSEICAECLDILQMAQSPKKK